MSNVAGPATKQTTEQAFADIRKQIQTASAAKDFSKEEWLRELANVHQSSAIRRSAITALRKMGSKIAWPQLIALLATEHRNQNLRETAIKALGELGNEETRAMLRRIAESGDVARFGQQAAVKALARLDARLAGQLQTTAVRTDYRDLFLCHASEDKHSIVRRLLSALEAVQVSYWYDEAEVKPGDSITAKVNEGLAISRYFVAVLTPKFLAKPWPEREFNAILNLEAQTGVIRLITILAGTAGEKAAILQRYPLISDKLYLEWRGDAKVIAKALKERLTMRQSSVGSGLGVHIHSGLPQLRTFMTDLHDQREAFARRLSRIKCRDAGRYLAEIGATLKRVAASIARREVPHDDLSSLRTASELLPRKRS